MYEVVRTKNIICFKQNVVKKFLKKGKKTYKTLTFPVAITDIGGVTALTLFEDFIYWSDQKSKTLSRSHKTSGGRRTELLNSWQTIRDIKVYHPLRQPDGITT